MRSVFQNKQNLSSVSGANPRINGYLGNEVYRVYRRVEFLGVRWPVMYYCILLYWTNRSFYNIGKGVGGGGRGGVNRPA